MDTERARELLAQERQRIEGAIANLRGEEPEEADDRVEPGDEADEGLYQDEFDAGRAQDYRTSSRRSSVPRSGSRRGPTGCRW